MDYFFFFRGLFVRSAESSCALRRKQISPCLSSLILKEMKLLQIWHINLTPRFIFFLEKVGKILYSAVNVVNNIKSTKSGN